MSRSAPRQPMGRARRAAAKPLSHAAGVCVASSDEGLHHTALFNPSRPRETLFGNSQSAQYLRPYLRLIEVSVRSGCRVV